MGIQRNLDRVLDRVRQACIGAGRRPEEVSLVAVTKTVPIEKIQEIIALGIHDIGESRVQEAQDKFQTIQRVQAVRWHMIGHLQRNKVNRASEIFDIVQSVDSAALARALDRRVAELGKVQDCLIELKVSEEPSKSGLSETHLNSFLEDIQGLKNLRWRGLMTIAPYFESAGLARPYFRKAREIFEKIRPNLGNAPSVLSMGMSHDFEAAIAEGSTMVRIGQALFGEREYR